MSVASRIIDGCSVSDVWNEGGQVTEVYKVTGVSGGSAVEKLFDALQASGLPILGEFHPTVPYARLTDRAARPMGRNDDQCRVTCTYRPPSAVVVPTPDIDPGYVTTSVTLQEIESKFDRAGNQILLTRTVTDDGGDDQEETQAATVVLQVPILVLSLTRRETHPPTNKARRFVGKVNVFAIYGEEARRWLCTRIDGESDDNGETYRVTYEFQRSMLLRYGGGQTYSSWDSLVVFEDGGRPIEDPVVGQSLKIVEHYDSDDFSVLGLNL